MNFTLELNKQKLGVIASSLKVVGNNLNIEIYNSKATLQLLETLNISSGDTGLMEDQITKTKSSIKFLETQQDLIQSIIKLAL